MDIKDIINKRAYIGRHTFDAIKNGHSVTIKIYRNCPRKRELSINVSNKDELIELSRNHIKSYVGSLEGKFYHTSKRGVVTGKKIDYFLSCFKYSL